MIVGSYGMNRCGGLEFLRSQEFYMRIPIQSPGDIGLAIRAVRRSSRVRIDDLAATAGVSKQFASDVEHGKPTVRFGLVLKLLAELGVPLEVDIPDEAARALAKLRTVGAVRRGNLAGTTRQPASKKRD
jgi:transcriptional regulator with XRE-family HTH domain